MDATYREQLKDPRWQKKRLQVFQRDNWQCTECGNKHAPLAVHHSRYQFGKKPWQYKMADLVTLCETCHKNRSNPLLSDPAELPSLAIWVKKIGGPEVFTQLIREGKIGAIEDGTRLDLVFLKGGKGKRLRGIERATPWDASFGYVAQIEGGGVYVAPLSLEEQRTGYYGQP